MISTKDLFNIPIPAIPDGFAEMFWRRVSIGEDYECWPWAGKDRTPEGYGRCFVRPRKVVAHRIAYFLDSSVDPAGFAICHSCDNPPCCNPRHLFKGTHMDNYRDSANKGRRRWATGDSNGSRTHPEKRLRGDNHPFRKDPDLAARGERQGSARLKEGDIAIIRRMHSGGLKIVSIAEMFGVSWSCIDSVVKERSWRHVKGA